MSLLEISKIWEKILYQVSSLLKKEPILSEFYKSSILQHKTLNDSLSYILAKKLSSHSISEKKIRNMFSDMYVNNYIILNTIVRDIEAILIRDPVMQDYCIPLLYSKGFHALQSYRLTHYLWNMKQTSLSMYFQNRISSKFSVDIHPAARIGSGVMLDHATGIVIGEGVIIEDNVSIFHSVTLGGTGKNHNKDRHPTIRTGVLLGAGATVLGNIEIGIGAKIGAGSIVLKNVPSHVTVVGIPAKIIRKSEIKSHTFLKKK